MLKLGENKIDACLGSFNKIYACLESHAEQTNKNNGR